MTSRGAPSSWVQRIFDRAAAVDIAEVTRLATTIDRRSDEVLAYFRTGRASSGPVEAVNDQIEWVDCAARGFRNFHHYRTRMLLKTAVCWHTPHTQESGDAPVNQTPPPPRSSRRARSQHQVPNGTKMIDDCHG